MPKEHRGREDLLRPGTQIGGYEVIRPLGSGGMGSVYLARRIGVPSEKIALKVLSPELMRHERSRLRFQKELEAALRVRHENVVRALELVRDEETLALALEFVPGEDLLSVIQRGPLPPHDVARILGAVSSGLAAIHEVGVVHRDMKPDNILIGSSGVVKITDLGVARVVGGATLTPQGAMVGTARYLAPEYIETGDCDHRGDIFALGVIGYEALSGRSPFSNESSMQALFARLKASAVPLAVAAPGCPQPLVAVIEKAMATRVLHRYQSAGELRDALRELRL